MNLSDEISALVAERDRLQAEKEILETRLKMQAGALEESRGHNRELLIAIERERGESGKVQRRQERHIGFLEQVLRGFGHSFQDFAAQNNGKEIPAVSGGLVQRLGSLRKKEGDAA